MLYLGSSNCVILLSIIVLGLALRIYGLDARVFWLDEVYNVLEAANSIPRIMSNVGTPVMYVFVHFALQLGKSEFILSFPSVVFGVLTILLVYEVARLWFGQKIGLVSAFLLSTSPMLIVYSRRVEHYSYFVFFSLLTLLCFCKMTGETRRKYWFLAFVVSTFFNLFSHVFSIFVLAIEMAFGVFYVLTCPRQVVSWLTGIYRSLNVRTVILLLLVATAAASLFLRSYYPSYVLEQIRFDPARTELGYSIERQVSSHYLRFCPEFFLSMFSFFGGGEGAALYLFLFPFFCGLLGAVKKYNKRAVLLILWVTLPFILLFTIGMRHVFEERYFLFIIPVYLILVSKGVTAIADAFILFMGSLSDRLQRTMTLWRPHTISLILIISLLASASIAPIGRIYQYPVAGLPVVYERTFYMGGNYDWKAAFDFVKQDMRKDDLVFVQLSFVPFAKYYFGVDKENIVWFSEARLSTLTLEGYRELSSRIHSGTTLWFVAERPIEGTLFRDLSMMIDYKQISDIKVFRLDLIENGPVHLSNNNSWIYSDDYSSLKYLKDGFDAHNVVRARGELSIDSPYHELSPSNYDSVGSIVYQFKSSVPMKSMKVSPLLLVERNGYAKLWMSPDDANYVLLCNINETMSGSASRSSDCTQEVMGLLTAYVKIELYRARLAGLTVEGTLDLSQSLDHPINATLRNLVHAGDTRIISNTESNLKRLAEQHARGSATATLVSQKVPDPREYGVAEVAPRITMLSELDLES